MTGVQTSPDTVSDDATPTLTLDRDPGMVSRSKGPNVAVRDLTGGTDTARVVELCVGGTPKIFSVS